MAQRIVGRRAVSLALAGSVAGLAVPLARTSRAAEAPKGLGTVTMAFSTDLLTLDGSQNVMTNHRIVFKHLYDPLVTLDPSFAVQPALAERWEHVDPLTWRFHLRPGVMF
ncbi:MAG: hypothetical protein ACRYHQ_37095, partial [Janthinobacterium lividum]